MSLDPKIVYDFEGNLPDALATAMLSIFPEINAIAVNTPPNLQKPRPRSDLMFRPGGSTNPPKVILLQGSNGPKRFIAAYEGDLEIDLITEPSAAGKSQHSDYRAKVRDTLELDKIRDALNALTTSAYQLDFISPTGSSDVIKTDQGYETSKLTYHIQFSIKINAFQQLIAA